ncbi:MAG: hypothetical protein Q8O22_00715 [Candidatus Omnitrophota bacterium]|nr:hypothetical protein [Candidatus Omnitrophota bacterium]
MRYDRCPNCGLTMPAHKGHTRTFVELTNKEKGNSIKMMTVNLKRAIRRYSGDPGFLWAINYLSRR